MRTLANTLIIICVLRTSYFTHVLYFYILRFMYFTLYTYFLILRFAFHVFYSLHFMQTMHILRFTHILHYTFCVSCIFTNFLHFYNFYNLLNNIAVRIVVFCRCTISTELYSPFLCRSLEECVLLPVYRLSASVLFLVERGTVLCSESESACDTARDSSLASLINCHNLSSNSVKIKRVTSSSSHKLILRARILP